MQALTYREPLGTLPDSPRTYWGRLMVERDRKYLCVLLNSYYSLGGNNEGHLITPVLQQHGLNATVVHVCAVQSVHLNCMVCTSTAIATDCHLTSEHVPSHVCPAWASPFSQGAGLLTLAS